MKRIIAFSLALLASSFTASAQEPNGWLGDCDDYVCYAKTVGLEREILVTYNGEMFQIGLVNEYARNTVYNGRIVVITKPDRKFSIPIRVEEGMGYVLYNVDPSVFMEIAENNYINFNDKLIVEIHNLKSVGAMMMETLQ